MTDDQIAMAARIDALELVLQTRLAEHLAEMALPRSIRIKGDLIAAGGYVSAEPAFGDAARIDAARARHVESLVTRVAEHETELRMRPNGLRAVRG